MSENNVKINTVGVLSGMYLSYIPFYFFIRFFQTIFKITGKMKLLALISIFLFFIFLLETIVGLISMYAALDKIYTLTEMKALNGLYDTSFKNYASLVTFSIIPLVCAYIINIILGIKLNIWLNTEDSNYLTMEDRYEVAKFAGIYLVQIPFYLVIKSISSKKILRRIKYDQSILLLIIAILQLLFFATYLNLLTYAVLTIICIMVGIKMNDVFSYLLDEQQSKKLGRKV